MAEISVKFVIVEQSEVCGGLYQPGHNDDCPVTPDKVERLEHRNTVSRSYKLSAGKSIALPLETKFQQALIPCIRTGKYAVLLVFDWGITLIAAVDLVRGESRQAPHRKFENGRYWYAHQNAIDFDPDRSVGWQIMVNDSSYRFYVVPAE